MGCRSNGVMGIEPRPLGGFVRIQLQASEMLVICKSSGAFESRDDNTHREERHKVQSDKIDDRIEEVV